MKIMIIGTSGSGKSTMGQALGQRYGVPVLHLDAVHFLPGWVERAPEEERAIVERFLDQQDGWVIDGNYTRICYERRLEEADQILVMWFDRFVCLERVTRRWWANRGRTRSSMAAGCEEKLDAEFVWWVLYRGRGQAFRQRVRNIARRYPEKTVFLRTQRQADCFLRQKIGDN
ncbi:MAG: DNA topology modulation protein FlaR [Faecalibacterium sp.]